jgi:hypothetical protein
MWNNLYLHLIYNECVRSPSVLSLSQPSGLYDTCTQLWDIESGIRIMDSTCGSTSGYSTCVYNMDTNAYESYMKGRIDQGPRRPTVDTHNTNRR